MQALGKEEKGRKQGTETRLTLSRTNTIATNLDLQNIFLIEKKNQLWIKSNMLLGAAGASCARTLNWECAVLLICHRMVLSAWAGWQCWNEVMLKGAPLNVQVDWESNALQYTRVTKCACLKLNVGKQWVLEQVKNFWTQISMLKINQGKNNKSGA